MRVIGHLETESAARRFGDFLYVHGVVNTVERDEQAWAIWVHDDDHLKRAGEWLTSFRANPADPQFNTATKATELREEEKQDLKEYQKRFKTRDQVFRRLNSFGVGKLTFFLIISCILVAVLSTSLSGFMGNSDAGDESSALLRIGRLADKTDTIMPLFITNWKIEGPYIAFVPGLPEIRHGQIWRLLTPMLIHFSLLHIVFNMLWLRDLGSIIEGYEGRLRFVIVVFATAAISNFAQYTINIPAFPTISGASPVFGGMSGVVYGMLGYLWMRGKFDPRSGLHLHQSIVVQMLIWLVLCFTGVLGPIANMAHLFGLLSGMVMGVLFSKFRPT